MWGGGGLGARWGETGGVGHCCAEDVADFVLGGGRWVVGVLD